MQHVQPVCHFAPGIHVACCLSAPLFLREEMGQLGVIEVLQQITSVHGLDHRQDIAIGTFWFGSPRYFHQIPIYILYIIYIYIYIPSPILKQFPGIYNIYIYICPKYPHDLPIDFDDNSKRLQRLFAVAEGRLQSSSPNQRTRTHGLRAILTSTASTGF